MIRLGLVVPCYNEQAVLEKSITVLLKFLDEWKAEKLISQNSFLLLVNDGSTDETWEIIKRMHSDNRYVYGVNLAANVGHQNALLAGLETVKDMCDACVSLDADLQDDVSVIKDMIAHFSNGCDIVYGVRNDRTEDTFFKRSTAGVFYKLLSALGVKTVYNHADFRLMSSRALKALSQYPERNLFLRGIVPMLGFKTAQVHYKRRAREKGKSKYSLRKMLSLAWNGITSFSIKPITLIALLGALIILCSIVALVYTLISFFMGAATPGWASLMISIWFLGGVQLFSIGVVGQYIGKTYYETKQRPRFFVVDFLKSEDN